MVTRNIPLDELIKKKSLLLIGPRGTGKSTYLRNQLSNIHIINLLKNSDYLQLEQNPSYLEEIVDQFPKKIIAIDEIQKIPALLDEVHRLIEEKKIRFLLTGSSARKLKSHSANLLAGRAWPTFMHPLNYRELKNEGRWDLNRILKYGSLPMIQLSDDPIEELDSYVQTYIESEIKMEGLVRKIPSFTRFLRGAAISHGELLNYQSLASDTATPASTIREHYHILEDTLIGYTLQPWRDSKKRKAVATAKFYFFDGGVVNQLSQIFPESENSPIWGNRFETLIINEIRCVENYQRRKWPLNFWRSTTGMEVDLTWGPYAIEIKSTKKVSDKHLVGLKAIKEEKHFKKLFLISLDEMNRKHDSIDIIHYESFLNNLWDKIL
jgi:predicted AAA+ superfamily ATPase